MIKVLCGHRSVESETVALLLYWILQVTIVVVSLTSARSLRVLAANRGNVSQNVMGSNPTTDKRFFASEFADYLSVSSPMFYFLMWQVYPELQ